MIKLSIASFSPKMESVMTDGNLHHIHVEKIPGFDLQTQIENAYEEDGIVNSGESRYNCIQHIKKIEHDIFFPLVMMKMETIQTTQHRKPYKSFFTYEEPLDHVMTLV